MRVDDGWEELSLSSSEDSDVGIGVATSRRSSFSFYKLSDPLLKLSVHKLDGSSFEIQVLRTASVLGLKMAVENVFRDYQDKGGGKISWSHVWSHFCLCYSDQKLTDDRAFLKHFGIKDGDQLRFIKHLSINHSPKKRWPKNYEEDLDQHTMRLTGPEVLEELDEENSSTDKDDEDKTSTSQSSEEQCHDIGGDGHAKDSLFVQHAEFKLAYFWRRWLSYSRLQSPPRKRRLGGPHSARPGFSCLRVRTEE